MNAVSTPSPIGARIHIVRGQSVMLDSDLAEVYGVETKRVNEAAKRNAKRFTLAYSFQLDRNEWDTLRSQIATLDVGRGEYRKYPPRVFTEHGAVMLATVLNSDRAIAASMIVVEAFVRSAMSRTPILPLPGSLTSFPQRLTGMIVRLSRYSRN